MPGFFGDMFGQMGGGGGGFNMGPPPAFGGPPGMQAVMGGMMGGAGAMMGPPPMLGGLGAIGAGMAGGAARGGAFGLMGANAPRTAYGNFSFPGGGSMGFGGMGMGGGGRGGGGGGMGGMGGGMMPFGAGMGRPMGPDPQMMAAGQAAASLYASMEQQRQAANAANEGRYQQGFGMLEQMHNKSMGDVRSISDQERQDINRRWNNTGAASQQSLVDRGLGNTTITENFRQGNETERSADLRRLSDQTAQRLISTRAQTVLPWVDFIQNRTDAAPDAGMMGQLAMQAGQAGIPVASYGGGLLGGQPLGFAAENPALARRMGWRTGGETSRK